MKNQLIWGALGAIVVIAIIFTVVKGGSATTPEVLEDGSVSGKYSIEGILGLDKAYECTFAKEDETSQVGGKVLTDGKQVYGEFNINTQIINQNFQSYLIIKDDTTYTWTSLQPIGYKAPVARSATTNASPNEQAQLVGTNDQVDYTCSPWADIDNSKFEIPTNITFTDLKQN